VCSSDLLAAPFGLGTGLEALRSAPLSGRVRAEQLDLGVLPALQPRLVPAAQGRLDADLAISGTPSAPRFTGRVRTEGTLLTIGGYGTYTGIDVDASIAPEAITVERLALRRGEGRAEGQLTVRRGAAGEASLEGEVLVKDFTVGRSGNDYLTIDSRLHLGGKFQARRLDLEVTAPEGVRLLLPRKTPRSLQETERRKDIVIGDAPPAAPGPAPGRAEPGAPSPLEVHVHLVAGSLVVKSDKPRLLVEVRTDSTWSVIDGALLVDGTIDLTHGSVEPMSGRIFKVLRGHVGFNGGPVGEAQLDIVAEYDNPSAKVTVGVLGPLANPQLRLTSNPPLDEASIAMLIATGRTEQSLGSSGSGFTPSSTTASTPGTFTAQDAGMAAAMAVANKAFQDRLGDKMPVDTLTLDSTSMSAGKYVSDRILVSYLRRFDARPDKGENTDEVRVQYQMSRRWTLESRYGNAGAGGASVLWQTDY
jgi:translocation and assembly module TamB